MRDALRERAGRCEICWRRRGPLDVHEISRGVHRAKSLSKLFCLIVVCRGCHDLLDDTKAWPEARQLAVLKHRRPADYDLSAYLQLTSPQAPRRIEPDEVGKYLRKHE